MPTPTDLLQGTLDLLILQTLALEPMHGWGIAQRIQQVSKDVLQIGRLVAAGFVDAIEAAGVAAGVIVELEAFVVRHFQLMGDGTHGH